MTRKFRPEECIRCKHTHGLAPNLLMSDASWFTAFRCFADPEKQAVVVKANVARNKCKDFMPKK